LKKHELKTLLLGCNSSYNRPRFCDGAQRIKLEFAGLYGLEIHKLYKLRISNPEKHWGGTTPVEGTFNAISLYLPGGWQVNFLSF
jgi:hypothetical protein